MTVSVGLFGGGLFGCSGGGGSGGGSSGSATLMKMEYGRLVDVYSFRRVDPARADRRDTRNRAPFLIKRDVVVSPDLETQPLFDAIGGVRPTADYRFLPFDSNVGHPELLILWDDKVEAAEFNDAFDSARTGLVEVASSYRGQNIITSPIPVMPRDAAILLTFSSDLGVTSELFESNPSAVQLLRFINDPSVVAAPRAFVVQDVRIVAQGNQLILDTTILGAEANGRRPSSGLQASADQQTANYRIALPVDGFASEFLKISPDPIANLNDVDSRGDPSVIRDIRSGNSFDGRVAALPDFDRPQVQAFPSMGVTAVDTAQRTLTVNKRGRNFAVRGRLPFVDGVIHRDTQLPQGPRGVPAMDENGVRLPLPFGDFITQLVVSPVTGETVRLRSEIIEVLEVGVVDGDANFLGPGLTNDQNDPDGGLLTSITVRVASIDQLDSAGNPVTFQAAGGLGADCQCEVRFYEYLRYAQGAFQVSDTARRAEFLVVEPNPVVTPGSPTEPTTLTLQPQAQITVRFTEPIDTSRVSGVDNIVITGSEVTQGTFQAVINTPKSASLNLVFAQLIDVRADGTQLRLSPPAGLFHSGDGVTSERYWYHIDSGSRGVVDLFGNLVDLYDKRPSGIATIGGESVNVPLRNFTVRLQTEPTAEPNLVGSRVFRFEEIDEDGTAPGSPDYFGQFSIRDSQLVAATTTRRSATADSGNLGSILRFDKSECVMEEVINPMTGARTPPVTTPPLPTKSYAPGALYRTPSMVAVQPAPPQVYQPPQAPQPFGGIVEPHTSRGARLQMTYREDDFSLGYTEASTMNIDVEQLYWAPWRDGTVLFDRFDRYTMRLAHSNKRPDLLYEWFVDPAGMAPSECVFDCLSLFSGLSATFADNVLAGTTTKTVVRDAEYVINPNLAFRSIGSDVKYVPYPPFQDTFTWRNHLLVNWDPVLNVATGLGGAQDANGIPPTGDRTANVSSPWVPDDFLTALVNTPGNRSGWLGTIVTRDAGDFLGDRSRDHDPIALPLLVDISVWPDDTRQVASSGNQFHIAYVGPIWTVPSPNGYYNQGGGITTNAPPDPWTCQGVDWPFFRVYNFGGPDLNQPENINFVDPSSVTQARRSVIKDLGLGDPVLGLAQTKFGDSHLHWAQVDLVRKISFVSMGFFDTLQPNRHALPPANYPNLPPVTGRPNFLALNPALLPRDVVAIVDPPLNSQPGGTRVDVQFRGVQSATNLGNLYDRLTNDTMEMRGNQLNPNYACEAFRYAMANPGPATSGGSTPRIAAIGMTPYVNDVSIGQIRDSTTGLLPRYLNLRLVLQNNIDSDPPVSPTLRSVGVVFRMDTSN